MAQVPYTVVNAAGEVLSFGVCDAADVAAQAGPGETAIQSAPPSDPQLHVLVDDVWVERAPRPSDFHVWNALTMQWVNTESLSSARDRAWSRLKAERDAREFAAVTWAGVTFDADLQSQFRIRSAALDALRAYLAGEAYSETWTLADNNTRVMSAVDMIALSNTIRLRSSLIHANARSLRALVDAADTVEECDAIQWPE